MLLPSVARQVDRLRVIPRDACLTSTRPSSYRAYQEVHRNSHGEKAPVQISHHKHGPTAWH